MKYAELSGVDKIKALRGLLQTFAEADGPLTPKQEARTRVMLLMLDDVLIELEPHRHVLDIGVRNIAP